jgi:formate dehydrogenase iron-sulfur subunit
MTTRIFVSSDAAALSVGAEAVAAAVEREIAARKLDAKLVRNGSRGMLWLEPLLEVETKKGRVGYGPVKPADVKSIFDGGLGAAHKLNLGLVESIPYFANQQRLTFAKSGLTYRRT